MEIVNSGTSIAPEHHERIFGRFYRVDKVRSRDTGGSGLGLAVAKWVINIHGGRIEFTSTVGKGSAIRISLPEQQQEKCPTSFR